MASINVNGTSFTLAQLNALSGTPQTVNTGEGAITLTNYVAATGVLSYSYSITAPQTITGISVLDSFNITVTDQRQQSLTTALHRPGNTPHPENPSC